MKLAIPGLLMLNLEWWSFELLNFLSGAIWETELAVNVVWFQLLGIMSVHGKYLWCAVN